MTLFNNLPQINPSRFVSKRNLQATSLCRIHDGFDGRFHDSAARELDQNAVTDFMLGHGCD
jgi:hypothetical protein